MGLCRHDSLRQEIQAVKLSTVIDVCVTYPSPGFHFSAWRQVYCYLCEIA